MIHNHYYATKVDLLDLSCELGHENSEPEARAEKPTIGNTLPYALGNTKGGTNVPSSLVSLAPYLAHSSCSINIHKIHK